MAELPTEFEPPCEYRPELAESFVGSGTESGRTRAFRILRPPSDQDTVIIADFFGGRPCKGSVQPVPER